MQGYNEGYGIRDHEMKTPSYLFSTHSTLDSPEYSNLSNARISVLSSPVPRRSVHHSLNNAAAMQMPYVVARFSFFDPILETPPCGCVTISGRRLSLWIALLRRRCSSHRSRIEPTRSWLHRLLARERP